MGNLPSCVECMEDDAFPRVPVNPDNNGCMCDSVSMKPLPSNSTNGGTSSGLIPFTTETTEDTVQISTMKPLGVTLCDSDSASGVFVTAIKAEGNVAKLTQPVSVGMLLMELNGIDVTKETLVNVIKSISDSPAEKILILKFRGTKPIDEEGNSSKNAPSTATTTGTASASDTSISTDAVSEKKEVESSQEEDLGVEKNQTEKDNSSTPTNDEKKDQDQMQEKDTETETETEQQCETPGMKSEDGKEDKEDKEEEEETWDTVSTPEKESFGDFNSSDPSETLHTVDMTTPTPSTEVAKPDTERSQEDLDKEFSNISLGDEEDEDEEGEEDNHVKSSSSSTDKKEEDTDKEDLLRCSQCEMDLPRTSFSASQLKKKAKRKCKGCK